MIIGFTGTRQGMSPEQRRAVEALLIRFDPDAVVHGDCVGADAEFDAICELFDISRRIRPCNLEDMRAHSERRGAQPVAVAQAPMVRNRNIVREADLLIACPLGPDPVVSGTSLRGQGTWATVGFARSVHRDVYVVERNGTVIEEISDEHGLRTIEQMELRLPAEEGA